MDQETIAANSNPTLEDGTNQNPSPTVKKKGAQNQSDKDAVTFVDKKKQDMKKSQYRERFDRLSAEIKVNIMNTFVTYGQKVYEQNGWNSMVVYNQMANGAYDINVYPQKITDRDQSSSGVPVSQEPIAFSKILIATSVLSGKTPDAMVESDDKIYSKSAYELWRRTWILKGANGQNTLERVYQNLLTYGWAAWRCYPRRISVPRNGAQKIIFDDIYREPLDPDRTWLGVSMNNGDYWSRFEVYYERDMPKSEFLEHFPAAKDNLRQLDYCSTSQEAKEENQNRARDSVTIGYYENPMLNKYIVKCGKMVLYSGELPNDENYGSVMVANCFVKNILDPHGVGLYEMMRGNTALFTYINSLNAQEVEAEIFPLLFGAQVQNGSATYKRSPNIVNPKTPGTTIDVVKTSGNLAAGVAFAQQQKTSIEENTGVNNIIAGNNAESTLGSTVILKEAAQNRLTPAKNSVMNALQTDAHIAWSWIKQTYSVDKIFLLDSDEDVAAFAKNNPTFFMQAEDITDDDGLPTGQIAVAAQQKLRLNYDFTADGELKEDVPTQVVGSKNLFDNMKTYGHDSDYIEFIIDPDSMLVPSMEIQKQTAAALFPVLTNQINLIYSLRRSDPEAAAAQLRSLETFLKTQKENIYNYIPKAQYDAIIALQPSQVPPPPAPEDPISKGDLYKTAPADVQRQIEQDAGLQPSTEGGAPSVPGAVPSIKNKPELPGEGSGIPNIPPTTPGVSSDQEQGIPVAQESVAVPQSPLGSAVDASMGRAAKGVFPTR